MKHFLLFIHTLLLLAAGLLCGACGSDDDGTQEDATKAVALLTVTPQEILANGKDTAWISVTFKGEDVTDKATIFVDGKQYAKKGFATLKAGTYEIHAVYQLQVTDKCIVTAVTDPNADTRYTDFRRRILAVQYTGTWCGYCPRVSLAIKYFKENYSTADDVVFAAAHYGDNMQTSFASVLRDYQHIEGYPTLLLNLNNNADVNQAQANKTGAEYIEVARANAMKTEARSNIRTEVSEPDAEGNITVTAEVKVNANGRYRVAAWLLEDNFKEGQNDYLQYNDPAIHTHHNVVCTSSAPESAIGEPLEEGEQLEAEHAYPVVYTFNPAKQCVGDPANCRVIIVVTRASGSTFYVDNVRECPIGGTVSYEYND